MGWERKVSLCNDLGRLLRFGGSKMASVVAIGESLAKGLLHKICYERLLRCARSRYVQDFDFMRPDEQLEFLHRVNGCCPGKMHPWLLQPRGNRGSVLGAARQLFSHSEDNRAVRIAYVSLCAHRVFCGDGFAELVKVGNHAVLCESSARTPSAMGDVMCDRPIERRTICPCLPSGNDCDLSSLLQVRVRGACSERPAKGSPSWSEVV